MMDHPNQSPSPIIPILLGAAIGAAAGVLLAPQPGNVTRQKVAGIIQEIGQQLTEELKGERGATLREMAIRTFHTEMGKRNPVYALVMKGMNMLRK
jgi:gas vesicle protein